MSLPLSDRDEAVVRFVGTFRQVSASHIHAVVFEGVGAMPVSRALRRLVASKYLIRVARRPASLRGGSGAFVYALGLNGHKLCAREGYFYPLRSIHPHMLKVADVFVSFLEAERQGRVKVLHVALEQVVSPSVRADMHLELGVIATKRKLSYFLEIDMGTERPKLIEGKLDGYWQRATNSQGHDPYVVFLVPDEYRLREIERLLKRRQHYGLFSACLFDDVVAKCLGA
jgi:hypothetical protein